MKKLICAKDVETAEKQGQKIIYIDSNTIITPSAKDVAQACGIVFSTEAPVCETKPACEEKAPEMIKVSESVKACGDGLDSEMIYKLLKAMMDKGLLSGILDSIVNPKYVAESASNGLKVVRGNSVKFDALDTGDPDAKVSYQELISKDESSMRAGFLMIDDSKFDRELTCQEINYVIEGALTVTIDGKPLTAYPGDVVYIPSDSKVTRASSGKAKVFYVTHPAKEDNLL
ncbi:ethanolamine utilization protein EutQ [Clostridium aceticum]|uniref:Ethanolamine utilization protein EutQ n=1 Tax=Clostridium aceticum TaxID=84022 RepID=A0A0D8IAR8_9CLOT|nr:cupin domain-containing protein [Clostridium aceticum]AKL96454.1 ethanolamine utilization protein EutQ [Clostridium aceticum]KJF27370.1 ethanolamine utilization protein EutQ [Clostridium aceticum]